MTQVSNLPGWESARLDEIAEVRLGRQRSPQNHTGEQMRPYLRAANLTWKGIDVEDVKQMNFTDAEVAVYRLREGDILVSEASGSASEVGKPGVWYGQSAGDVCFQNTLLRVRPGTGVDSRFLYYRLLHEALRGGFARSSRGVGIHHLGAAKLAALPLGVPPTDEQSRIAALLDAEAPAFEAAASDLGRVRRLIGQLRHQILVSTVASGSSSQLTVTSLADVSTEVRNGVFVSRAGSEPDGTAILRVGAVRALALNLDDPRWTGLASDDERIERYLLEEGDLLFTRYNGNADFVGACAVVPPLKDPLVYPDKLIRVRLNPQAAFSPYVAMLCSVGEARHFIRSCVRTTAGQAGIAGRDLRRVPLTLPSVDEQRRLWMEAANSLARLAMASQAVEKLAQRVEAARRGLIGLAVTGGLGTGNERDEPAASLLISPADGTRKQTRTSRKATRSVRYPPASTTPTAQEPRP